MAHRSRPKNYPIAEPRRGGMGVLPGPEKPHPGYPSKGPALPGDVSVLGGGVAMSSRTPGDAERYLPKWNSSNSKDNQLAESERLTAERILEENRELISETRQRMKHDAREVDIRFKQRVGDIAFWKTELDSKLTEVKDHIEYVTCQHDRVNQALAATKGPLAVSEQCLAHRVHRQGNDRIDDNVEKHLKFEVETLKSSQTLLLQSQARLNEELRQLQKSKFIIEKDLKDKEAALDIDSTTATLKVTGPDKKKGITRYAAPKANVFTPADWQLYSQQNLELATTQMKSAKELNSSMDGVLAHVASHLRTQKDLTDRCVDRRIKEVKAAKKVLEDQLSETVVKVGEVEDSVISLEKAIGAKQGPLATAQLKIQQRKQRPNVELVLDDVDYQLQIEAENLIDTIHRLEAQLAKSRNCYASLQKSRLELEALIGVKTQSIYIDEVKCRSLRAGVDIQAY